MTLSLDRSEIIQACYDVPGQTWPTELGWLYDELQHSTLHAEIGTYCGRSLLATCGGMRNANVFSVDDMSFNKHPDWVEAVLNATLGLMPESVHVKTIRSHSVDAARHCHEQGMIFDSVFIDACHEYAECKADIELWQKLIRPGGMICGHDYWPVHSGVMNAVNDALEGRFQIFGGTRIWFARL